MASSNTVSGAMKFWHALQIYTVCIRGRGGGGGRGGGRGGEGGGGREI